LQNELQYESDHDGQYDRACHVDGRQDGRANRLPRKNVCGLDGSGISILSTTSVGNAFGSGAPASCFGDEGESCGNIESETTAVSPAPT